MSARPSPLPVRPYAFPAVHRVSLANGMRLIVAPMPRLPLVSVHALVDAGASADPVGAEGLAALTARALDEGTATLDGPALADRFEGMGTSFSASASWDATTATVTALPHHLHEVFALFAEVMRAPRFSAADVVRLRDERLDELAQLPVEPRGLADHHFSAFVYASGARYAQPAGGSIQSVASLDHAQVRQFHTRHYGPLATTLVVVGDVTVDSAVRMAEQRFGDWQVDPAPRIARVLDLAPPKSQVVILDKPDAPQTELRIGHVGVPRQHPDYLDIVVMNAILGGLFSSRINLNLRERHAFTYGASSEYEWRRAAGPFVVSTAVQSDVTARAVTEILNELNTIRSAPPSPEELSLATEYLAGVFPLRYETTSAVAGALAVAALFDLPEDWFSNYRSRIRAVTPTAVHAAAVAHVDPSRLVILAVGDPAVIADPLAALDIAPVAIHRASANTTSPQ